MCGEEIESLTHLFIGCNFVQPIWEVGPLQRSCISEAIDFHTWIV